MEKIAVCLLKNTIICGGLFLGTFANAQVTPDGTTSTTVLDLDGQNFEINNGDRANGNLFHSFQDFSIPNGGSAVFNNPTDVINIFSRVTGTSMSNIDGLIQASGGANLFLLNPNGIIFGENARLQIGGSFIGSTADSIVFPGSEFSASNPTSPFITINAPIGLNFRDNPGSITNRSIATPVGDPENFIGLEVSSEETIGLIGGDIFVPGGVISTPGGRIELGSVSEASQVGLAEVAKGWDFNYEGITNFGTIDLNFAFITTYDTDTGDIEVQGGNISLVNQSLLGIDTFAESSGNLTIRASDSLSIGSNSLEGDAPSFVFNNISGDATGQNSTTRIEASQLTINNGSQITSNVSNQGQGVDIVVNATDIVIDNFFVDILFSLAPIQPGIFAQDGGKIAIATDTLTLSNGGQITTNTFGANNAGELTVNAQKSVDLIGTVTNQNSPSGLFANVSSTITATGNAGNLSITTPQLVVQDGAQIGSAARNSGSGGTVRINADSILLTGTSSLAELEGQGRSGISVSAQPAFRDSGSGDIIPTVGNGGSVIINAKDLTIENGAIISINTFSEGNGGNGNINVNNLIIRDGGQIGAGSLVGANSPDPEGTRGNGGRLNINTSESLEITGIGDINDELVPSSIFTLAQSTGKAGDLTITTGNLTISDGGDINTSAIGTGEAGTLNISANTLDLEAGQLIATTAAGTGGNINLDIDNRIILSSNSLISAAATGNADGGNINIDTNFIITQPNQNSDIIASSQQATGGRIIIDAEGIFGPQVRTPNDSTSDIDASGGVDGEITINTPDVDITRSLGTTPPNIIEAEQTATQSCSRDRIAQRSSSLILVDKGGTPPQAVEPFMADPILLEKQASIFNSNMEFSEIKPIQTGLGNIYPARGIIKTDDGKIILTSHPINKVARTLNNSSNCSIL